MDKTTNVKIIIPSKCDLSPFIQNPAK